MSFLATVRLRTLAPAALLALLPALLGCAPRPSVSSVAVPPISPGQARIWFYRDYEPSVSLGLASVSLNGVDGIHVAADGAASYRDVPSGHYHITVESFGRDANQSRDADLAVGEEAFVKILSLSSWESSGDLSGYRRDTFYVSLVPPGEARAALAAHPFAGAI